jgi:hypothetical protein
MPKPFQAIPGPFGGTDERATTDAFEDYVGGVQRAQRLLRLYNDSYPFGTEMDRLMGRGKTKNQVFRDRARIDGFKPHEIEAFFVVSR